VWCAVSVSDLLFCLVGIPAALLATPGGGELAHLYHVCRVPLHNLFLFSSTWIAALVAAERFFVVVSPLRARMCLKVDQKILSYRFGCTNLSRIINPTFQHCCWPLCCLTYRCHEDAAELTYS